MPDDEQCEVCPYCDSDDTEYDSGESIWENGDYLAYNTCLNCDKEWYVQYSFVGIIKTEIEK